MVTSISDWVILCFENQQYHVIWNLLIFVQYRKYIVTRTPIYE